jgi:hypothetical protein
LNNGLEGFRQIGSLSILLTSADDDFLNVSLSYGNVKCRHLVTIF